MQFEEVKRTDKLVAGIRSGELPLNQGAGGRDAGVKSSDTEALADYVAALDMAKFAIIERGSRLVVIPRDRFERINSGPSDPAGRARTATGPHALWNSEAALLITFPELADEFTKAKERIDNGTCKGCSMNAATNKIIAAAAALHVKHPERTLSPELVQIMGAKFGRHVARLKYKDAPYGSYATPAAEGSHKLLTPKLHTHYTEGLRPTCLDCARKHLGHAVVLLQESEYPEYANHFWLGLGHMGEAESETLSTYPAFAKQLRDVRLAMMADRDYLPNIMELFDDIDMLEAYENEVAATTQKQSGDKA